MSKRPQEPDELILWREGRRRGTPRCCHTCEHYTVGGDCQWFGMRPPDEFASELDACDQWVEELPF